MNERLMNKRNRQRLLALKRRLNFDRQQEQHLESLPADSNLNMNIAMKILSPGPTIMSSECSLHENSRLVQRLTGSHEELASSDCMKSNSNYCPASGRKSLTNDFTKNNSKANNSEIMIKKRRRIKRNQIQANNMWKTNLSLISKLLLSTATTAAISNGKRNLSNQQNALAWSKLLLLGGILLNVFCSMGVQSALNHVKLAHRVDLPDSQQSLLKSANVELNRSLRFQRDILPINNEQLTMGNGNHQAPTCGYPGSPAHASVTFNTSHVVAGTAASYTCDNGYELLGPPRRICQSNGTWSPIGIPFCVLNVGLGKAAMQSSTAGHGSAQKAVDGSTSAYFQAGTCTMTDVEHNPWWYVNLLEPYLVQIVRIDFGTACCANRQKATIAVRVGNNRPDLGNNPLCNRYHGFIEEGKPLFLPCTRPAPGAFVSIHLESPSGTSLSICETFIYTDHALSIEQCPSFRDQPLGSTATYNGKCYLFHNNQALDFDNARKYCESRGGTLVDETSPALQGFLSWELYRRHRNDQLMGQYWLGATRDTRNPQNWKWINGKDVQVSFWNSLESKGNCSRFDGSKGWLWSNTDCSTQLNFVCQYRPLSCGKPEKPTNSTLVSRNVDNGTVIEYQCAPGNLLMGPKSRACLPTGFFSEFAPKCKYLDCQFPAMIPNGDYKLLNGTTSYQSIVNYFCQDGYQLYGKATLQCDVDERWNGPPPRCEPLLCSAPVPPSNGYVTVTANVTVPGTQAEYGCRPGYELVGDRLLSCLTSGSWDNSFPYCREKLRLPQISLPATNFNPVSSTSTTSTPSTPTTTTTTTASITTPKPNQRIQQQQAKPIGSVSGSVQFPKSTNGQQPPALFTSSRISPVTQSSMQQPTTSTTLIPPAAASHDQAAEAAANSSSASLNGLANQFTSGHQAVATSNQGQQVEQDLRKLVVNQVQSVIPPLVALPAQPSAPIETQLINNTPQPPRMFRPATQPNVVATTTTTTTTGLMQPQQQFGIQLQGQAPIVTQPNRQLPMNPSAGQTSGSTSASNKFSVVSQSGAPTSGQPVSSVIYDSSPLATTNSISVHQHQQQPTLPTTTTTATSSPAHAAPSPTVHSGFNGNQANVLGSTYAGSLGSSMRHHPSGNHNSLASAKYSLDGIIAVAIFGGFIFLGAIITIIVIIIRRKSSHSSTIDAQTISTYDSNNEHNGLYRNYQQAWENLRFASPTSQPKSSGGPVGPMGLGPAVGLKTLASAANNAALIHHMHGAVGAAQVGMIAGSTSSSQSSSSLGGANHAAGIDPLLRDHHHHHHNHSGHHHHHHHHANNARRVQQQQQQQLQQRDSARQEDDEEVMSDEQGVLSSDEANYQRRHSHHLHHHHHQSQLNEGFRDSNELTINADQVLNRNVTGAGGASVTGPMSGQVAAGGRRIYSSNGSIGRSNHRISGGNLSLAEHHSHHNHHHHGTSSNGSSQHQRLVSSSTPSTSTRSSRASPPSDDHSLDQLAYGNSWHPVVAGNQSINRE